MSDYNGFFPNMDVDKDAFDKKVYEEPVRKTPIQQLLDDMLAKTNEAREMILMNLISNPGVVATFGEDFVVEFGDIELYAQESHTYDALNEYPFEIIQKWRIRKREEVDGRSGLGRDSGGEEGSDREDSGDEHQKAGNLYHMPVHYFGS